MEELYDKIEQYLKGELREEELRIFKQQMEADAELKAEVAAHRLAREAVEVAIEDSLRKELEQLRREGADKKDLANGSPVTRIRRWRPLLAIAASLLLLAGVFSFWHLQSTYSPEAIASRFYDQSELTGVRSAQPEAYPLAPGLQALREKKYTEARDFFSSIAPDDPYYQDARYYLANVYFQQNDWANARSILQELSRASDLNLSDKSEWLLALTYVKAGELDNPRLAELLQKIQDSPDHSYREQARQMEEKLESFWAKLVN